MKDRVTIKIPKELYEKLQEIIANTGFSSVTEFIVFTMRTIAMGGKIKEKDRFKKEEIKEVKKRLKKLGYL
jgi:metal-responsive CopG/Arc/MetJ family transcriptional regulator